MAADLSKHEIDRIVTKSLETLDPKEFNTYNNGLRPYKDLIGTFYIKGSSLKHRAFKKPVSLFVVVFKKVFEGYLEQRTRVDSYLYEQMHFLQKSIDGSLDKIAPSINHSVNEKLDAKLFETQVLIDKFKKEIIYELVELRNGSGASPEKIKAKIIHKSRVESLKKVNIGSGTDILKDYINVDHRSLEGVDVVADVLDLPFDKGSLDEVYASHVAEHFVEKDLKSILRYWFSLLSKGGAIRLVVPNIEDMAKRYAAGEIGWSQLRSVALGGQDYASDYHFNHFSVDSMQALIEETLPEATFTVVAASRKRGDAYEMEVLIAKNEK